MTDPDNPEIETVEYLRYLARRDEALADDPACRTCAWAADEIERLRAIVDQYAWLSAAKRMGSWPWSTT